MCQALQDVATRKSPDLLTNIPPNHSKSMVHSVLYQPWVWTFWPQHRFGAISYDSDLVLRDAVKARNLIESDWYQSLWPLRMSRDTAAKGYYVNEFGGSRKSDTIRGGITGNHFDDLLVDDPQNPTKLHEIEVASAEAALARHVWDVVIPSRVANMQTSRRIVVMQRLAMTDLSQHIIDQAAPGDVEHLMLPLHFDPERACRLDWRTEEGELLAPERYTEEEIRKRLPKDKTAELAQYEQDPTAEGAGLYSWGDFKPYVLHNAPANGILGVSVDGATAGRPVTKGGADANSNWAVEAWLRADGAHYLLEVDAFKEDLPVVIQRIQALLERIDGMRRPGWRPGDLVIERRSTGEGAGAFLKGMDLKGFTVEYRDATDSKVERAHAAMVPIREGRVFLPAELWDEKRPPVGPLGLFKREIQTFPRGRSDDLIDAMNQILLWWQAKFGEKKQKPTTEQMREVVQGLRSRMRGK